MLKKALQKYASAERRRVNERFFKMGEGEYSESDVFLGVRVPCVRKVAREYRDLSLTQLEAELTSKFHEVRQCAIIIITERAKLAIKNGDTSEQKRLAEFYLKNLSEVNNWDLVDVSAKDVLGEAVRAQVVPKKVLEKLLHSKNMWERRVALLASWAFIRAGESALTLSFAKVLVDNPELLREDLTHKALGWMLREAWKLGCEHAQKCEAFLRDNYANIPRTTLRYTIEKMPEPKRKKFLNGVFR